MRPRAKRRSAIVELCPRREQRGLARVPAESATEGKAGDADPSTLDAQSRREAELTRVVRDGERTWPGCGNWTRCGVRIVARARLLSGRDVSDLTLNDADRR